MTNLVLPQCYTIEKIIVSSAQKLTFETILSSYRLCKLKIVKDLVLTLVEFQIQFVKMMKQIHLKPRVAFC